VPAGCQVLGPEVGTDVRRRVRRDETVDVLVETWVAPHEPAPHRVIVEDRRARWQAVEPGVEGDRHSARNVRRSWYDERRHRDDGDHQAGKTATLATGPTCHRHAGSPRDQRLECRGQQGSRHQPASTTVRWAYQAQNTTL